MPHAAGRTAVAASLHQQPVVRCGGGDQEVPEWALQWLVAGNRTPVYQLQGGQRARPHGLAANWLHVVSHSLVVKVNDG